MMYVMHRTAAASHLCIAFSNNKTPRYEKDIDLRPDSLYGHHHLLQKRGDTLENQSNRRKYRDPGIQQGPEINIRHHHQSGLRHSSGSSAHSWSAV
jgi:hypothetical protein